MLTVAHALGLDDIKTLRRQHRRDRSERRARRPRWRHGLRSPHDGAHTAAVTARWRAWPARCASRIMQAALGAGRRQTSPRRGGAWHVADAAQRGDREAVRALLKDARGRQRRAGRRHDRAALGGAERRRRARADAGLRRREREGDDAARRYTPLFLAAREGKPRRDSRAGEGGRRSEAGHGDRHDAADGGGGVRQRRDRAARCSTRAPTSTRVESVRGLNAADVRRRGQPRRR